MQAVTIERTWELKDGQETNCVTGELVTIHHIYAYAHTTIPDPTYGWGWWICLKSIFAPDEYSKNKPFKERIADARKYRKRFFSTWHTRRRTHYDFEAVATVDGKFELLPWELFQEELMYDIWEEIMAEDRIAA